MAPKRIYLQWHGDSDPAEIGEPDETGVTWSRFREFEGDVRYTRTDLYMEAIARAEAAEKRVQELEAQLAAQWRPVTKPPTDNETQCLLRKFTKRWGYEYKIASWTSYYENPWKGITERDPGGYWLDDEGEDIDIDDWQEWQPLPAIPAPPQDTPASGRHEGEE